MCVNNNCTDTTPCSSCQQNCPETNSCKEGCTIEIDANCVQYTGEDLNNIDVTSGDWLQEILIKLNDFTFTETFFQANNSDTIVATANGTKGHSPFYNVKLDPISNAITKSSNGLKVALPDGKVKVNSVDTLDYLEAQILGGTDNVITITPTVVGGAIYLVPSINKEALINLITDNICAIASECIPASESTTTTTSTSSTTTSSTSTTSTSTTTTEAPATFDITNLAGQGVFDIVLRDEMSLIEYVSDNITGNNQSASYTYSGSTNQSELVIQHGGNVPVGINIKVNGVVIYNSLIYIGSVTIPNLTAKSDIEIIMYPYAGTTTTSTSTTSTSTSSSTTTLNCVTYSLTNTTGSSKSYSYTNCEGIPVASVINNSTTLEICAVQGSLIAGTGVSITEINSDCSTTTTSTSTTTSTTSTSTSTTSTSTTTTAPCDDYYNNTGGNVNDVSYIDCFGNGQGPVTVGAGQSLCVQGGTAPGGAGGGFLTLIGNC